MSQKTLICDVCDCAPLYNKNKISFIAKKKKKKKKKNALPTWKNLDGWTLNMQFFLFGLNYKNTFGWHV